VARSASSPASASPGKNLGAYGDGGMVTTSDPAVVERTRRLRNYGERAKYDHVVTGVNSRLDGLQAAFLSVKLAHLPSWNEARLRHADLYTAELDGLGDLVCQQRSTSSTHMYHLFIVETVERDALRDFLTERRIQTGIHYPIPIHLQEAYDDLGLGPGCVSTRGAAGATVALFADVPRANRRADSQRYRRNSRILRVGAPALSGVEKRVADLVAHLLERGASEL